MALTDFTTYDDIRAALGVSSEEIEDATISLPVYEFSLQGELEDVDSTLNLILDFATVVEIAPGLRTAAQSRFFQATYLFATYAVARHLTSSLPLFSPKEVTDGKASVVRYAQDPYERTIERVEKLYEKQRVKLAEAYAAFKTTSVAAPVRRVFFVTSAIATDPVTGA